MKKLNLFTAASLSLAALACSALVGCEDYTPFDENEIGQKEVLKAFSSNFVKAFGEPDPNHSWGFGLTADMVDEAEMQKYVDAWRNASLATRGSSDLPGGAVNTNVNQWTDDNKAALKSRMHVPGWPNDDNYYYTQGGKYFQTEAAAKGQGNVAGDVTNYEIEYVSRWFREHKVGTPEFNAAKVDLHISDFFIQQVSTDYDRVETDGKCNGARITRWEGQNTPNQDMQYMMDKLDFLALDGSWTHVNNFNAHQNLIKLYSEEGTQNLSYRNIMYVTSSGTESFEYHPSMDNSSDGFYEDFVLVCLTWEETMPSGITTKRTGYYLAFDYRVKYNSYEYEPDGFYSNWIVKITPSYYKTMDRWPKRFMCEDLGDTFDFDFNDAVFDLTFAANANDQTWYDAIITIQAAAGTMPIYVGISSSNADYEIHRLLGQTEMVPINAGPKTQKGAPAIYRVKKIFQPNNSTLELEPVYDSNHNIIGRQPTNMGWVNGENMDDLYKLQAQMAMAAFTLEIHIMNPDPKIGEQSVNGWEVSKNLRDYYKWDGDNKEINGKNAAPQLFNCSIDAEWMQELEPISSGYPYFHDWVQNEQCKYRLAWDKERYFARDIPQNSDGHDDFSTEIPVEDQKLYLIRHTQTEINDWQGAWDLKPKAGALLWSNL